MKANPYHVLVSEAMLQQTQVKAVIPYFVRFIEAFPTVDSLATADEQAVLRLWQGLGYYSRARNLRRAAQVIVEELGGAIPCDVESLLRLPGVGRYTAGAIASIAFDTCAPILDGNVARVVCRIDRIKQAPSERSTQLQLWSRATELVPEHRAGDFNTAMMELGATVCVPRNPACLVCPVREHCEALAAGEQEQIPAPKPAKATPLLERTVLCIRQRDPAGNVRYLIEQRPATGRWASMWQFLVVEPERTPAIRIKRLRELGTLEHALTHRRYRFSVWLCSTRTKSVEPRRWVTLAELEKYPLPRPHVKIAEMLKADESKT